MTRSPHKRWGSRNMTRSPHERGGSGNVAARRTINLLLRASTGHFMRHWMDTQWSWVRPASI
eukprot:347175-Chlamydomonas_euryale.AAC.1